MKPIPFEQMLGQLLTEYRESKLFYGVSVMEIGQTEKVKQLRIGPAAGPHTQLAANIVAAFAAGASVFELKTVQILVGDELGIQKPCIYAGNEVFNTEWSTELTVAEAEAEYIKAFILIQILDREFSLNRSENVQFIVSVGYDLNGIQSQKIDQYLEHMKHAGNTQEWETDFRYLKEHSDLFSNLTLGDIEALEKQDQIADTVTLSTMHGCPGNQIEQIIKYLLEEKKFHTYVKMNPTLVGYDQVKAIFQEKGYGHLEFSSEMFEKDITLDEAEIIVRHSQTTAQKCGRQFGVKMTNTFPVKQDGKLAGDTMYLSGKALYALSIQASALLADRLDGNVRLSYSGGADLCNIATLFECGFESVTVSSILLQPGGYFNLTRLITAAKDVSLPGSIHIDRMKEAASQAVTDRRYDYKPQKVFESQEDYSRFCAKCKNCADVCPNRANVRIERKSGPVVIHIERLCNECGACCTHCPMGHQPYLEKFTVFEDENMESIMESIQKETEVSYEF